MSTLRQRQYEELRERLAELTRSLRVRWPAPVEARDEEVAITAYPVWREGQPVLSVVVACSLRLLPVLRRHGYSWALHRANTREEVDAGRVVGRLGVEVAGLAEGEYALEVKLLWHGRRRAEVRRPLARLAAASSAGPKSLLVPYEVIATFRSPEEDAAVEGTCNAELRRSGNQFWTLWVQLTGAAAETRLARFAIQPPPGGASWQATGFVGTD